MGTHKNHLSKEFPTSSLNLCFGAKIRQVAQGQRVNKYSHWTKCVFFVLFFVVVFFENLIKLKMLEWPQH